MSRIPLHLEEAIVELAQRDAQITQAKKTRKRHAAWLRRELEKLGDKLLNTPPRLKEPIVELGLLDAEIVRATRAWKRRMAMLRCELEKLGHQLLDREVATQRKAA